MIGVVDCRWATRSEGRIAESDPADGDARRTARGATPDDALQIWGKTRARWREGMQREWMGIEPMQSILMIQKTGKILI